MKKNGFLLQNCKIRPFEKLLKTMFLMKPCTLHITLNKRNGSLADNFITFLHLHLEINAMKNIARKINSFPCYLERKPLK